MPSSRVSSFIDLADLPEGQSTRALPPASTELLAPADVAARSDAEFRHAHPARRGRPPEVEQDENVGIIFEDMRRGLVPERTAAKIERTPEYVKNVIKTAREKLVDRLDDYLDAHMVATKVAAMKGDADPAQWALEHIAENGQHVVDPPKKEQAATAPTFNIGFNLGGLPQQQKAKALPAITVEPIK